MGPGTRVPVLCVNLLGTRVGVRQKLPDRVKKEKKKKDERPGSVDIRDRLSM